MDKVGFSDGKSFGCIPMALRDICCRDQCHGLVWANERSTALARPHLFSTTALSVMGDPSAIFGAGLGCRQPHDPLSKAGLDGSSARRGFSVFHHPFSQWIADARDRFNGWFLYFLLSP